MLDEDIIEELVDNLNGISFVANGGSFSMKSMWGYEFKDYEFPTVTVNIEDHSPGFRGLSSIHSKDVNTGKYTFSQEMIADVELRMSSRAKTTGNTIIHQRFITREMLRKVKDRVLAINSGWGAILRKAGGSVIESTIQAEKDMSDFDMADNSSVVMISFQIRYEEYWDKFIDDVAEGISPQVDRIEFTADELDADTEDDTTIITR